jgi:hypothetical protein
MRQPKLDVRNNAGLWMNFDIGMYEPLHWPFDAYPSVVPRVRVRGVMALFLAATILWALVW